nr:CRAL-TRIO lipid binding domain-containing protein [Tanacetum cinerariifolium]
VRNRLYSGSKIGLPLLVWLKECRSDIQLMWQHVYLMNQFGKRKTQWSRLVRKVSRGVVMEDWLGELYAELN